MKLFEIIAKNILLLLRAKSSALIVIAGPLLVILLAGLAFDNTNTYAVKIGTYSSHYNDLSNSFVEKLSQNQFAVTRYETEETCVQGLKNGDVNTCVVFAPEFTLAKNQSNEVMFYVDYSKLNLVWTVLEVMTQRVNSQAKELSLNLTAILLRALDVTRNELAARQNNMITYTTLHDDAQKLILNTTFTLDETDLLQHMDNATLENLTYGKIRVNYWLGAMKALADKSLAEARKGIGDASKNAPGNISNDLKDSGNKIDSLRKDLDGAGSTATSEINAFNNIANGLQLQIEQTRKQLEQAQKNRDASVDSLALTQKKLNDALLQVLTIQKSMNDIKQAVDAIQVTDASSIVQPIQTTIKPVIAEKTYLNYIFPILIVMIIMFTALLVGPMLVLLEKNSAAHFRNFMSPTHRFVFDAASLITTVFLLIAQIIIIMFIASMFFSSKVLATLQTTSLLLACIILLFALIGILIGKLFGTEETANLAGVALGSAFLFISDVILPIETMPPVIRWFSAHNPFVVSGSLLRKAMVFNAPLNELLGQLAVLIGYIIGVLALIFAVDYLTRNAAKHYKKWKGE